MTFSSKLPQYQDQEWALVVLNGPSGDAVPDLGLETFVCNGNFLRRRWDHIVSLDHQRVQFARQHGHAVWTRPRFCRRNDRPVPDTHSIFNDSGNAAIWAAHTSYNRILIAGADSWLGGELRTVCDEIYPVATKKDKLPPRWFTQFQAWSGQTPCEFVFIWPTLKLGVKTQPLSRVLTKYNVGHN
jgi:hypothetical protein